MAAENRPSVAQRTQDTLERHLGNELGLDAIRLHPFLSLRGRVGVVTGASKGIGRGVAELLAIHEANLVIHGRDEARLTDLAEIIDHMGQRVEIVVGDTANPETANKLAAVVKDKFNGQTDIMVNNAGFANDKGFDKYGPKSWGEFGDAVEANLLGPLRMTSTVYRGIQAAKDNGRIISIGSVSGEYGLEGQVVYDASKAGMAGVTRAWGSELLKTGGTANMIAFGPVETAIWDRSRTIGRRLAERAGGDPTADPLQPVADRMIAKRFTTVEEAAQPVLYLASEMGSQTTRQVLVVDGGITALRLA